MIDGSWRHEHSEEHPLSQQQVLLRLSARDPAGALFSGQEVVVLGWVEHYTGQSWLKWREGATALQRRYLRRVASTGISLADTEVVAVGVGGTVVELVHDSEIRNHPKSAHVQALR